MNSMIRFLKISILSTVIFLCSFTKIYAQADSAMAFDGVDDYIDAGGETAFNLTGDLTVEAWFYINAMPANDWVRIVGKSGSGISDPRTFGLWYHSDGTVLFQNSNNAITNPGVITTGQWYHMAGVKSGDNLTLYLNGNVVATGWSPSPTSTGPLRIGFAGFHSPHNGQIDEVRIWNMARAQSEIRSSAHTPLAGAESGLVALYHLDEVTDFITPDATINNLAGTLINGPFLTLSGAMHPFAPTGLKAVSGVEQTTLKWQPNFESNFQRYRIYMGTTPNPFSQVDSTVGGINDTTKIFSGLTNFTTYYFRITAVDMDNNQSPYSNEISSVPSVFTEVIGTGFENASDGNFVWGDYDNDGNYDVFISGKDASDAYPPYTGGFAKLYRHETNGSFTEINAGFQQQIWRTAAAWGDYNNDGFLDLVYTGSSGDGTRTLKLYKNNGNGTFSDVPTTMEGLFLGSIAWGDYDNDGDQDLFEMGSNGYVYNSSTIVSHMYRNDGNDIFTSVDIGIPGYVSGSCAWGDYDNDNDLDLLILGSTDNSSTGAAVIIYRNNGNGTFSDIDAGLSSALRGQAVWADYDSDGKLDIAYAGSVGSGERTAIIYHNDGNDVFSDIGASLTGVALSTVSCGDFDNDGDMDFFFSGTPDGNSTKLAYIARNDGMGEGWVFTQLNAGIAGVSNNYEFVAASAFVDYDRDGDLDLMVEGETIDASENWEYVTKLYKNESAVANQIPTDPTGLDIVTSADTVWFRWTKSTDAETPQDALTYNIRVGTTPAGIEIMSPMAKVVGSGNAGGFRLVQAMGNTGHNNSWRLNGLADGTYYWSVEAIDQVYRNSKFQTEQSFIIDGPPTIPANLRVSAGLNSATLTWDRSQKSNVERYVIVGGMEPGMTDSIDAAEGGTADTSKVVAGLEDETIYYFRVYAIDPAGHASDYSAEVSVKPSATPGRIWVTSDWDNGPGSITEAINTANQLSQSDTISFDLPVEVNTIYLWSELPAITGDYTIIDGDLNSDGIPDIVFNGNGEGRIYSPAFTINSSNNVIQGLIIHGCGDMESGGGGILISGSDAHNNRILSNYIGTVEDYNGYGIWIDDGAHDNWIGDGTAIGRNVISGNQQYGILIGGSGVSCDHNKILGNFIGIDADGLTALPNNGQGIQLHMKASHNLIGNATIGGRNIISGNTDRGIYFLDTYGGHLEGNMILGNYIGTNNTGMEAIPNQYAGIVLEGYDGGGTIESTILNTQIGNGTNEGINVISGNGMVPGYGIEIYSYQAHDNVINKNYFGVGADGVTPLGNNTYGIFLNSTFRNTITNNIIAHNENAGIYLSYSNEMTISGNVISANQSSGIQFDNSSTNTILGNRIGTDPAGTGNMANIGYGIDIEYQSNDNQIGDGTPAGRNIISGNSSGGIRIFNNYNPISGNKIFGNYIGTDVSGNAALPNAGNGVKLEDYATYNEIGGQEPGKGNIISGNGDNAIYIGSSYPTGGGTDWNKVQGNIIGLGADGSTVLANDGDGIYADGNVRYLEITKNVISGNSGNGIYIYDNGQDASGSSIVGNYIGTDATGVLAKGNDGTGIYISGAGGFSANLIVIGDGTDDGKNIVSGNSGCGITISGNSAYQNKIQKNYVGVNINGAALANALDGVRLENFTYGDSIIENVISGNGVNGIVTDGSWDNVILGNMIGTDPSGMSSVANGQAGIYIHDSWETYGMKIGDGTPQGRNIISGNGTNGIMFFEEYDYGIYNNTILGNYIGTAADGISPLGNAGSGISFQSVGMVASTTDNELNGNIISHNSGDGVTLDGSGVHSNFIFANSIYDNTGDGIAISNGAQYDISPTIIDSLASDYVLYGHGAGAYNTIQIYYNGSDEEGQIFFGTTNADEAGNWNIELTQVIGNLNITALQSEETDGRNTSAFSAPFASAPGVFIPDSSYLNFGNIIVGDSLTLMIEAAVTGNGIITTEGTLDFESMFRGISGTEFPDTSFNGEKITGYFQFKPTTFGTFSDTIRLTNNSSVNPLKIYLQGNGAPGTLVASASTVNFGNILVGDSSTQTIRMFTNNGPVVLDSAKFIFGTHFMLADLTLPDTLFVGDTINVTFKFKPTVFGTLEDTLRLINNSSVNPFHIILSGTGSAGVLTAIPSAPDFGQVLIGNSSLLISKIYPLTGLVVVDSARLLVNTHYGIDSTKQVLDTMFVYLKFTPTILGTIRDTLLIFNNSSVNPFTLALSGTGKVNTAPNAFNVKPVAGALTNDLTPTLTWEGRGDVDGDAVTYTLEVSKNANMSSPQVTQGGLTDTTFTLGSNLDQVALYYFRVTATDTRGGSTLSNTGFFRTDAQAPVAAIGALTLKVVPIKKYLQVYVATSEKLKTDTVRFILNSVVDNSHTLTAVGNNVYSTEYELTVTGSLDIKVTGTDTAGNFMNQTQNYTIATLSKDKALALNSDGVELTGAKGSVKEDGFILVSRAENRTKDERELQVRKTLSKTQVIESNTAWEQVGASVEIISTVELKKALTLKIRYTEEELSVLRVRYPDFDERKVGLYREEDGKWVYEGGEGRENSITAKIEKTGSLALFYNPTHEFLPKSIELSQNYPNPFNPSTTIKFGLPDEGRVKLVIYNILGQRVKELLNETRGAGYHTAIWNGKNETGQQVSSGLYIYRLESAKGVQSKKMLLIK